jgi:hypothetical protein
MEPQMNPQKEPTSTCYVTGCGATAQAAASEFGTIANHRTGWVTRIVEDQLVSFCPDHAYKHEDYLKLVRANWTALAAAKQAFVEQWSKDNPVVYDWRAP